MSQPLDKPALRTAPLPAILQSVKHDTRGLLATRLNTIFQNADDALFEMADAAATDAEQNLYFDSMRIVRLQRASIQQKCIDAYSRSWGSVMSGEPAEFAGGHDDELEVSATAAGISTKATARYLIPITQLTQRLEDVCGHELAPELNPLGPQCLNQNFISAMAPLDVHIKVRVVLLQLFERFVAQELSEVYDRANQILITAGVLPELDQSPDKNADNTNAATPEESRIPESTASANRNQAEASSKPTTEGFDLLQGLLTSAREAGHLSASAAEQNAGALVSTPELMQSLGIIQDGGSETPFDLDQPEPPIDFRALITNAASEATQTPKQELEKQTDDVVDLVQLLFDFILNDRNLAIPMKALIARLQIPVLKVAIMDQSLFAKPSHPARKLLNELAEAGIGWSGAGELKRDETYNKIESIVFRVINGFTDDLTLFSNLIAELQHFVNKETRKRNQLEQRVRQTEAGKAKTQAAKKTVQTLINQKACGLQLPEDAGHFLSDAWSEVLVYIFVTQGTDSEPWKEAAETLDDLVWATQPLTIDADINRREEMLPRLFTQLEAGVTLANLADAQTYMTGLRSTIETLHRADQELLDANVANAGSAAGLSGVSTVISDAVSTIEQPAIVLLPEEDAVSGELETLADSQFIEKIIQISEGQWVELRENSGSLLRCKLATIAQPGNRYVFVNRKGMKVCERTRNALALALQADELHLIDETEMFDRALESVIGDLQRINDTNTH